MKDRADLIVKYFDYLTKNYNFNIVRKEFDHQAMGNAVVIFSSLPIEIEVVIDRDQAFIRISSKTDLKKEWFNFADIAKYYAPLLPEVYVFLDKTMNNSWDDVVEYQLQKLSQILDEYCKPILKGEFLAQAEIRKIEAERTKGLFKKFNIEG